MARFFMENARLIKTASVGSPGCTSGWLGDAALDVAKSPVNPMPLNAAITFRRDTFPQDSSRVSEDRFSIVELE
jgi:hypothetical protein